MTEKITGEQGKATGKTQNRSKAAATRYYTIRELADAFDITLRTIRYYEDEKLIRPTRRGTQRLYDYKDYARLELICRGKKLGFNLAEIKEFLNLYTIDKSKKAQMSYLATLAQRKITHLETQKKVLDQTITELHAIQKQIDGFLKGD